MKILITILGFLLIGGICFAGEDVIIYNPNWTIKETIRDGKVYGPDWTVKGYIRDNRIYDKNWQLKGIVKPSQDKGGKGK